MPSFEDFRKQIDATIKDLNSNRKKNTLILSKDAFALVFNRVVNTGEKATGGKFEAYSPGYKTFKAKTRQVAFRDFKMTNDMWRGIGPVLVGETAETITYLHGAIDPAQQDKIDHNVRRSGNFLELNQKEIGILDITNNERLVKALKDNGIA